MKITKIFVVLLVALMTSACSTQFLGSAPADEGHVYVVGADTGFLRGWRARVWRCPDSGSGECEKVKVRD